MAFEAQIDDDLEKILILLEYDREKGLARLRRRALIGNKSAIEQLALALSEETPITEEAIRWLVIAEQFGSADAAWNLAMTARERGNLDDVKKWIDRAASLGEEDAIKIQKDNYDVEAHLKHLQSL